MGKLIGRAGAGKRKNLIGRERRKVATAALERAAGERLAGGAPSEAGWSLKPWKRAGHWMGVGILWMEAARRGCLCAEAISDNRIMQCVN